MILRGRLNGDICNIYVKDDTLNLEDIINRLQELRLKELMVIPDNNTKFEEIMSRMVLVYQEDKLYQLAKGNTIMLNFPILIDASEVAEEFSGNDMLRTHITSKIFIRFSDNKAIRLVYNTETRKTKYTYDYKLIKNHKKYYLINLINNKEIKI